MVLEWVDFSIVLVYLIAQVALGLYVGWRQNRGGGGTVEGYLLGRGTTPWWALAASGMSSNLDMSGTMLCTGFIYCIGLSGFFVEIRGGVTLYLAFLMTFMGKWMRRSGAMTQAEWMDLRFGSGSQGRAARACAAVANLVYSTGSITFFAVGGGKFGAEFILGRTDSEALFQAAAMLVATSSVYTIFLISALVYLCTPICEARFQAAAMLVATSSVYTIFAGVQGVIWTDCFQATTVVSAIVGTVCFAVATVTLPETFQVGIPLGGGAVGLRNMTLGEWRSVMPADTLHFPKGSPFEHYNSFHLLIVCYLFRTLLEGHGGPGGYTFQRFAAASSDLDCGNMAMLWTVMLSCRWPFVASIAALAIFHTNQGGGGATVLLDPEAVLPWVIHTHIPTPLKGIVVAGMLAAGMSTYDSAVNAAAAYWVKDLYLLFINPDASPRLQMLHSRAASAVLVVAGLLLSTLVRDVNEIWGFITMGLTGGMLVPIVLRWYWWRLNGYGFAVGILSGTCVSICTKLFLPDVADYLLLFAALPVSLTLLLIVTFSTPPTSPQVLDKFYRNTRPWGLWGPVTGKMRDPEGLRRVEVETTLDRVASAIAVVWQISLFLLAMVAATDFGGASTAPLTALVGVTSLLLYLVFYRPLRWWDAGAVPLQDPLTPWEAARVPSDASGDVSFQDAVDFQGESHFQGSAGNSHERDASPEEEHQEESRPHSRERLHSVPRVQDNLPLLADTQGG